MAPGGDVQLDRHPGCVEQALEAQGLALHGGLVVVIVTQQQEVELAGRRHVGVGAVGGAQGVVVAEHAAGVVDVEVAGDRHRLGEQLGVAHGQVGRAVAAHGEPRDRPVGPVS